VAGTSARNKTGPRNFLVDSVGKGGYSLSLFFRRGAIGVPLVFCVKITTDKVKNFGEFLLVFLGCPER